MAMVKKIIELPGNIKNIVFISSVFPGLSMDEFLWIYNSFSEFSGHRDNRLDRSGLEQILEENKGILDRNFVIQDADINREICSETVNNPSVSDSVARFLDWVEKPDKMVRILDSVIDSNNLDVIEKTFSRIVENTDILFNDIQKVLQKAVRVDSTDIQWMVVYFIERRRYSRNGSLFLIDLIKHESDFEIRWNAGEALKKFHTVKNFPLHDAVSVLVSDVDGEIRRIGFDMLHETTNAEEFIQSIGFISGFAEDEIREKALEALENKIQTVDTDKLCEVLKLYADQGNRYIKGRLILLLSDHFGVIGLRTLEIAGMLISDEKSEVRIKVYDLLSKMALKYPVAVLDCINTHGIRETNFVARKILERIVEFCTRLETDEKLVIKDKLAKLKEAVL